MTAPTSRPMKKPQISSGLDVNSIGPGRSPCSVTATRRMAEVAAAGNSERERGDETGGNAGIVRRFRRDDAFGRALAELLGMARGALRHAVSKEVRRRRTDSGNHSEKRADGGTLNEREQIAEGVAKSVPQRSFQPTGLGDGAALENHAGEFGDGKQSHHDRHEADAVEQIEETEGVTL